MGTRTFILPFLTAFIISSLLLFLSCADKAAVEDEQMEDLTEEVADATGDEFEDDSELTDMAEDGDLSNDELYGEEEETADDLDLPSEEQLEQAADDLAPEDQEFADSDLEDTYAEGDMGDNELSGEDDLGDALGLPDDSEFAEEGQSTDQEPMPSDQELSQADTFAEEEKLLSEEIPQTENTAFPAEPPTAPAHQAWSGHSSIPSIPSQAFMKSGANLNRFYFVRAGDTPDSVSQLIYGSSGKAGLLQAWNAARWLPGTPLYYESNLNPHDQNMRSFYEERKLPAQQYTVRNGDWLSLVAEKELGHIRSYKELAVLNDLASADNLESGQQITFYPDLSAAGTAVAQTGYPDSSADIEQQLAASEEMTPPPNPPEVTEEPTAIQSEPPVQFSPPPQVKQRPRQATQKASKSFDIARLIQQNLFFIVVGAGILLLLGALVVLNKRRRSQAASEGYDDDIFGDQAR